MQNKIDSQEGESVYVILDGEISGTTREDTYEKFKKVEENYLGKKIKKLYVDISAVDYIDSIGIALLVKMNREFRNRGTEFCLTKPTASVKKIFVILGLENVFNLHEKEVV